VCVALAFPPAGVCALVTVRGRVPECEPRGSVYPNDSVTHALVCVCVCVCVREREREREERERETENVCVSD
jgi:hypothetical protein